MSDLAKLMRVCIVDPSSFTAPYDHALCAALAHHGAGVTLATSRFAYGETPHSDGYRRLEMFYRHSLGAPGSRLRQMSKLAQHVPNMLALRGTAAAADVTHFQWLDVQWLDRHLLPPGPLLLTAHDLLPREPRPGQTRAQRALYERMDAVIAHSDYGRGQLVRRLGLDPARVHVVPHGAFTHLTEQPHERPLPPELARVEGPVVLFFGLLRPYKGIGMLLAAWRGIEDAELWIVGRPRMPLAPLRAAAPPGVRFVTRYIADSELPAYFRRADLVALPYAGTERFDQSGVLATALAFGKPAVVSDIGGLSEITAAGAAESVAPGDPAAWHRTLTSLLADSAARARLRRGAMAAAAGPYSWDLAARRTLAVYHEVLG